MLDDLEFGKEKGVYERLNHIDQRLKNMALLLDRLSKADERRYDGIKNLEHLLEECTRRITILEENAHGITAWLQRTFYIIILTLIIIIVHQLILHHIT